MLRLLLLLPFVLAATVLVGPLLIRVGVLSPLAGFGLTLGAWVFGVLAGALAALIGMLRKGERPLAWYAAGVGAALAAGLVLVSVSQDGRVPIHDITTNLMDPPEFKVATEHPDNAGRDMSYPHGHPDTAALQQEHYDGLGTYIICDTSHAQVWDAALATAETMGWNVIWANAAEGLIEAEATTGIFRFVDDVVVRLRDEPLENCSSVDVRSLSRVGQSDLGANAARIRAYDAALTEAILQLREQDEDS